jgi:hypothetical protein
MLSYQLPLCVLAALTLGSVARADPSPSAPDAEATALQVHHKPGHHGGPPWLRQNRPGRGYHSGWTTRRGWEDGESGRWRGQSRVEEWIERPGRSSRFRTDPF